MIIGHASIVAYLLNSVKRDNPTHAYLFYGPSHIGKFTVAAWFAKALLCHEDAPSLKPCDKCKSCAALNGGVHPDFLILNKEKEEGITINEIRTLQSRVSTTPFYNSYKIAIINPAENFTRDASHAFLKILEEPPQKSIFILINETHDTLLPTIISRVESIRFSLLKERAVLQALPKHYSEEQKQFIADRVKGKIGIALEWNAEKIKEHIEKEKLLLKILKAPPHQKIILIEQSVKKDEIPVSTAARVIRDLLLMKFGLQHLSSSPYLKPEYQKIAPRFSSSSLQDALQKLQTFPQEYKNNVNKLMLWHTLFLNLNPLTL